MTQNNDILNIYSDPCGVKTPTDKHPEPLSITSQLVYKISVGSLALRRTYSESSDRHRVVGATHSNIILLLLLFITFFFLILGTAALKY